MFLCEPGDRNIDASVHVYKQVPELGRYGVHKRPGGNVRFWQVVHKWICSYSVPALNGVVGIVFLALSACVIVSLLGLRTHTASALIGIAMVTFPSVVSSNMFMFTTAEYDFAVLLAVLAVYFTLKYRFGFIGGCLLMVLSLAIYVVFHNGGLSFPDG